MSDDYTQPINVKAHEGSVVVLGPVRMEGSFTADAAEESAMRLLRAAAEARAWINPALARSPWQEGQ